MLIFRPTQTEEHFAHILIGVTINVTVETGGPERPGTGELPRQSRVRTSSQTCLLDMLTQRVSNPNMYF